MPTTLPRRSANTPLAIACWCWANSTARETPLLVRQLVDDYSRNGAPVLLALELPRAENPVLRDYLESDGGAAAPSTCTAARSGPYATTSTMVAAAATCWR